MTRLYAAAREIVAWLARRNVPTCIIGGLAVARWGEPRLTRDVDLTVLVERDREEKLVDALLERFHGRRTDARAFALRYRVLLLETDSGVPVDIALGATAFEAGSVARSSLHEFEGGCELPTCGAEDLIVHKAVAGRPRDVDDLVGIVNRQYGRLDLAYVRRWLSAFSTIDGMSDVRDRFEAVLTSAAATARRARRSKGTRREPRRRR